MSRLPALLVSACVLAPPAFGAGKTLGLPAALPPLSAAASAMSPGVGLAAAPAAVQASIPAEQELRTAVGPHGGVIPAAMAAQILERTHLTMEQLLLALVPLAKDIANPEVSGYPVGAVGLGGSGDIHLGGNLSFIGVPISQSVHAEQAMVANAASRGETQLQALAVSDQPCGHCRQFLRELEGGKDVKVLTPLHPPMSIDELLPHAFLWGTPDLLGPRDNKLAAPRPSSAKASRRLLQAAFQAANASNSSYNSAGVAIKTKDGRVYSGRYLEVSGANPSLPPLQSALVALAASRQPYSEIEEVVLVELRDARVVQEAVTRELLSHIAPGARLTTVKVGRR